MRIHWKIGETGNFGAGGKEGTGLFVVVVILVVKKENHLVIGAERGGKVGVN
jgi:hypothetical protein